jgi:hypothetical protein
LVGIDIDTQGADAIDRDPLLGDPDRTESEREEVAFGLGEIAAEIDQRGEEHVTGHSARHLDQQRRHSGSPLAMFCGVAGSPAQVGPHGMPLDGAEAH